MSVDLALDFQDTTFDAPFLHLFNDEEAEMEKYSPKKLYRPKSTLQRNSNLSQSLSPLNTAPTLITSYGNVLQDHDGVSDLERETLLQDPNAVEYLVSEGQNKSTIHNTPSRITNRNAYIERDRHGRERLVIPGSRWNSSHTRLNARKLLDSTEEQEEVLINQNKQLENQLAWSQAHERRAKEEYSQLAARLEAQIDVTRRLQERLKEENNKVTDLEERIRLMHRTGYKGYRQRYEELLVEVESLRAAIRQRDELIRVNEVRLSAKTQTIIELKAHLRSLGYRVIGE